MIDFLIGHLCKQHRTKVLKQSPEEAQLTAVPMRMFDYSMKNSYMINRALTL